MNATAFGISHEDGVTNSISVAPTVTAREAARALEEKFGYYNGYFDAIFLFVNGEDGPEVAQHWDFQDFA